VGAPADAILGLQHDRREAELARAARRGKPGRAGADDDQIGTPQACSSRVPAALATAMLIPT